MNDEKFEPKVVVPKTVEEELQRLIEATCHVFRFGGKPGKSNPLWAMYRDGELTYENVMKQAEAIRDHRSDLSAGKRQAVIILAKQAVAQFNARQKQSESKAKEPAKTDEQ